MMPPLDPNKPTPPAPQLPPLPKMDPLAMLQEMNTKLDKLLSLANGDDSTDMSQQAITK